MRKRSNTKKHPEILDAALTVFCDHGYDVSSMDMAAAAAGASTRTVHNHFGTKRDRSLTLVRQRVEVVSGAEYIRFNPGGDARDHRERIIRAELEDACIGRNRALSDRLTAVFPARFGVDRPSEQG